MSGTLKIGDVVTMKSQGPKLIVSSLLSSREGIIECKWFNCVSGLWTCSHASFHEDMLEKDD